MSFSICSTVGANVGAIDCDVRRGRPLGLIIGSAVFSSSNYATQAAFKTAFQGKINKAAGSTDKLFPFPEIQGVTDKTDAPKEGTYGYGLKQILLEGKPAYEFAMIPGSAQEKQMRKFHNKTVPVFIFDDAANVWGKMDASANFIGTKCLISVIGKGFEDGQNVKQTIVQISFISAGDFYDAAAFFSSNFTLSDLVGLVDVTISEQSARTSNVFHVQGNVITTQVGVTLNLADYFTTVLNSTSLWKVDVGTTFQTPHAITTVAYQSATKTFDITLDTTQFTALSGGAQIRINLIDPATLNTAGVTGIEGIAVITAK